MNQENDRYFLRGVSASKTELKKFLPLVKKDPIFEGAFCQGIRNPYSFLSKDKLEDSYYFHHADGIGTKGSIAYLYFKETGSLNHFSNLIQDAWIMNIDDLICVGAKDHFTFSTIISRNKNLINEEILGELIRGEVNMVDFFKSRFVNIHNLGGETADMGDVIKSLGVDATCTTFVGKDDFIDNRNINPGQVIVGLSSFGKTTYEDEYNSGIGCNGLTSAKHDLLDRHYCNYPESYDVFMNEKVVFNGDFRLSDTLNEYFPNDRELENWNIGKLLLSPTRSFLPIMKEVFLRFKNSIKGMIHNSGGGQTKCLNFTKNIHFVKNNLFDFPPIFQLLRKKTSLREMFQIYNCGHRMEIYTDENTAAEIIDLCSSFNLAAKIVGYTESSNITNNELSIIYEGEKLVYGNQK